MVSKKDIEGYDFKSINEYFDYIVESEVNGQRTQVTNLIDDMNKSQKKEAYTYISNNYGANDSDALLVKTLIFNCI